MRNRSLVPFFMNPLEFTFAAVELIEAGATMQYARFVAGILQRRGRVLRAVAA